MKITFDLHSVTPIELSEELFRGSLLGRLSYVYLPILIFSSFALVSLMFTFGSNFNMVLGFLISGFLSDKTVDIFTWTSKRRFTKRFLNSLVSGQVRLVTGVQTIDISDRMIFLAHGIAEERHPWNNVRAITQSYLFGFIQLVDGTLLAVPKIFPEVENSTVFLRMANQMWKRYQLPPSLHAA